MKINITHIAKLANIPISQDEEKKFQVQLSSVLNYIEKLNEVDTTNIEETSQVTGLENILQTDAAHESLGQKEATSQAQYIHNGFFAVKGVFENE